MGFDVSAYRIGDLFTPGMYTVREQKIKQLDNAYVDCTTTTTTTTTTTVPASL
jgi:hypothetical protein